jgi:hypothetical protein
VNEVLSELEKVKSSIAPTPPPVPPNASLGELKAYVGQLLNDFNAANVEDIQAVLSAVGRLDKEVRIGLERNKVILDNTRNLLVATLDGAKRELDELKNQVNDKALRDEIIRRYTATLQTANSDPGLARTQLAVLKQRNDVLAGDRQRQFDGIVSQIQSLKSAIEAERASLLPAVQQLGAQVQKMVATLETLASKPVATQPAPIPDVLITGLDEIRKAVAALRLAQPQPQNNQQTAELTQALEAINKLVTDIPASIRAISITAPAVNVSPPQVTVPPANITVSTTEVTAAINDLIAVIRAGGANGNGNGAGQASASQASPPPPSDFELKRDTAVAALQQVIEQYKSYVRNAGDAVPYLKRPYRAEVYYDVSEKRHKTRGVPALVPSREFSNLLATGGGALGAAITALANARAARARAHVQHPHVALGVLRMNTVVVGHPAGPASRGVVPLDAPGHLATALHGDVAAAEYAVQQAFYELEGKLSPYEEFRVFPPGDARRDAPMPTDVDALFLHAASLEATRALDRILARVHVRSASCWPQQGIHPFDTLEALQTHVYTLIAPRTQPSASMLDKERREAEALARQVAAHETRQREARIYREAREAARKAEIEAVRLARLVARA